MANQITPSGAIGADWANTLSPENQRLIMQIANLQQAKESAENTSSRLGAQRGSVRFQQLGGDAALDDAMSQLQANPQLYQAWQSRLQKTGGLGQGAGELLMLAAPFALQAGGLLAAQSAATIPGQAAMNSLISAGIPSSTISSIAATQGVAGLNAAAASLGAGTSAAGLASTVAGSLPSSGIGGSGYAPLPSGGMVGTGSVGAGELGSIGAGGAAGGAAGAGGAMAETSLFDMVGKFAGPAVQGVLGMGASGAVSDAASQAAATQAGYVQEGITAQQRQIDAIIKMMEPYVTAGTGAIAGLQPYSAAGAPALAQQRALAGIDGPEAQRAALAMIEQSPEMQAYTQQGENAILQNASATGGLRGGNTQGALAQFRPQLLAELVNQQYGRLGGLTALGQQTTQNIASMGQASAAGQGAAGMQSAANIAALLGDKGAAIAGGQLAQGGARANMYGTLANVAGTLIGQGGF